MLLTCLRAYLCFCLCHCMKIVQIRSFFWSVFSYIQSDYRKIQTTKISVFEHFHVVGVLKDFLSISTNMSMCNQSITCLYSVTFLRESRDQNPAGHHCFNLYNKKHETINAYYYCLIYFQYKDSNQGEQVRGLRSCKQNFEGSKVKHNQLLGWA